MAAAEVGAAAVLVAAAVSVREAAAVLAAAVPLGAGDGQLSDALRAGRIADGLMQALADVSTLLEQHFPCTYATPNRPRPNELPDMPFIAS